MATQKNVQLRPMTTDEYLLYAETAIQEYAAEKVRAGNWKSTEALEEARKSYAELLPEGVGTPKNFFFSLLDSESNRIVGMIWYRLKSEDKAFILDFKIDENDRGKGYGRAAILAAEQDIKNRGVHVVELHVFGHNARAIELYKSSGYIVTNMHMKKELGTDGG